MIGVVELDAERGLLKLNPLFDWTRQAVLDFVKDNKSVLACSFHAIADPDRTDEDKAFGVLRIGTE